MKLPGIGYQIDTYQSPPNEIVLLGFSLRIVFEDVFLFLRGG